MDKIIEKSDESILKGHLLFIPTVNNFTLSDKGMEVIKRKLDNKTKGAKSLQGNKSDQDVENTKRQFLEYLEKERSK